jgi:hypothetical protein
MIVVAFPRAMSSNTKATCRLDPWWMTPALAILLVGCTKKLPTENIPRSDASAARPSPTAATPSVAVDIDEASVQKLVDDWVAAQKQRSIDSYTKLYAEKITVVKRSGPQTATFDRQAWLEQAKYAFRDPITIKITNMTVARVPTGVQVTFHQAWQSAGYHDRGRKRLRIVKTDEGLRIDREEMLDSILLGGKHAGEISRETFMLASEIGVQLEQSADLDWGKGRPARAGVGNRDPIQDVDENTLPPDLLAWKGRQVRLLGEDGPLCETEITGFVLHADVIPHFGEEWLIREKNRSDRVADKVWERLVHRASLDGTLAKTCKGARWAMASGDVRPVPPSTKAKPISEKVAASVRVAFRALPAYKQIEREWQEQVADATGWWDETMGSGHITSVIIRDAKETLVVATAGDYVGCGDYVAKLTAFFRLAGSSKLTLISSSREAFAGPVAGFDLDGDGHLEIMFEDEELSKERGLYFFDGKAYRRKVMAAKDYQDCGC